MPFRRRRWDEQPQAPCDVLLASDGRHDFSSRAVARAAALAGDGGHVAVVTIAKIYGSSYGLPNPGLLPTKRELAGGRGGGDRGDPKHRRGGVGRWRDPHNRAVWCGLRRPDSEYEARDEEARGDCPAQTSPSRRHRRDA